MVVHPGKIEIKNLGFECILGTLSFERITPQPILVNVNLEYDFSEAAASDDLKFAVNYAALSLAVRNFISEKQFQLIESLVYETARFVLESNNRILSVEVAVEKPEAIPMAEAAKASIRLER